MLCGCGRFASSALWKAKVWPVEIEGIGAKTILLAQIQHITFIAMTYPKGGAWYS